MVTSSMSHQLFIIPDYNRDHCSLSHIYGIFTWGGRQNLRCNILNFPLCKYQYHLPPLQVKKQLVAMLRDKHRPTAKAPLSLFFSMKIIHPRITSLMSPQRLHLRTTFGLRPTTKSKSVPEHAGHESPPLLGKSSENPRLNPRCFPPLFIRSITLPPEIMMWLSGRGLSTCRSYHRIRSLLLPLRHRC